MNSKSEIRKDVLSKRDSIDVTSWKEKSICIAKKLQGISEFKNAEIILAYSDYRNEVETLTIIEESFLSRKRIFMPKVIEDFNEAKMEFYEIFSINDLMPGFKGIKEPVGSKELVFDINTCSSAFMLVPGVAFSKDKYRLGYGKGYYDNYLKDKSGIIKCGLSFDIQIVDSIPVYDSDIKMDMIVTENRIY